MRLKIKLASAASATVVDERVGDRRHCRIRRQAHALCRDPRQRQLHNFGEGEAEPAVEERLGCSQPPGHFLGAGPGGRALPNTTFAANNGAPTAVQTTAKGKGNCTGTITGPQGTFSVTQVKLTANSTTGGTAEANCAGLVPSNVGPPTTFTSTLTFKVSGAKLPPGFAVNMTSDLGTLADQNGLGFLLTASAGQIQGYPTGTSVFKAYTDATTVTAITAPASTSTTPSASVCEAQLKLKVKKGVQTTAFKAPKGLKKITIAGPSNLVLHF